MADVNSPTDTAQAVHLAVRSTADATKKIRRLNNLDEALRQAEALREQVGEPAVNVRFLVIVDEYVRVGQNFTRLGESLGLTRQRAQQLVAQARKRGIAIPPKK